MRQPRQYIIVIIYFVLPILGFSQSRHYSNTCQQELGSVEDLFESGCYLAIYHRLSTTNSASLSCSESLLEQLHGYQVLSACYIAMLQDADIILTNSGLKHPDTRVGDQILDYLILEKVMLEDWNSARYWFEQPHYFGRATMLEDDWQLTYGYTLFQIGQYQQAILQFSKVPEKVNSNYFLSQYYTALCYTNLEDLDTALEIFRGLENYAYFKEEVPDFIGEILYEQQDYSGLIKYAWPYYEKGQISASLARLAGLAAHAMDDCQKSTVLLDHYMMSSEVVHDWEYYTKALCDYKLKNHTIARSGFEKVAHVENEYGQMSNYYLADIYMNIGDLPSARNAFFQASLMSYDTVIQAQSQFYYAKLSAQLKYDHEALITLRSYNKSSRHYKEAQEIMKDVLLSTADLDGALQALSTITDKSTVLSTTQHRIEFLKGIELVNQGEKDEAMQWLELAASKDLDLVSRQEATFWLGEIANQRGQVQRSEEYYSEYLSFNTKDEKLKSRCYYGLGYIFFSASELKQALQYFSLIDPSFIDENSWIDIQMRIGDCHLAFNDYTLAEDAYKMAISNSGSDQEDYALYQLATINGLQGKHIEKLILLERVIADHEGSAYMDDALYESGIALMKMEKPKDAIRSFQSVIDGFQNISSLVVPSLLRVGLISYNLGDNRQAADYYKNALGADPTAAQKQEALIALKEIYVNDLARPDVYLQLISDYGENDLKEVEKDSLTYLSAHRQFNMGRYDRAIEAYNVYINKFPGGEFMGRAHYELAECHLLDKSYPLALDHFILSCKKSSLVHSDGCFKGAEIAYHYAQDFDLAMELYRLAESRARTIDESIKSQLGVLRSAHRLNNDSVRLEYGQKVLNQDKISVNDQALAHYSMAKGIMSSKDSVLAIPHLNFVVKNASTEFAAECRYLMALLYYQNDENDIASTICDEANKRNVNYPYWVAKGLVLFSDILRKSGDDFNAMAALQAVIENGEEFSDIHQIAKEKLDVLRTKLNKENKLKR